MRLDVPRLQLTILHFPFRFRVVRRRTSQQAGFQKLLLKQSAAPRQSTAQAPRLHSPRHFSPENVQNLMNVK